jgi:hypothetical protein
MSLPQSASGLGRAPRAYPPARGRGGRGARVAPLWGAERRGYAVAVSWRRRLVTIGLMLLSTLAAGLGVVYVVVACQSLPSFLGGVAGDPHPRTGLGAALLVFAVLLGVAVAIGRRLGRSR